MEASPDRRYLDPINAGYTLTAFDADMILNQVGKGGVTTANTVDGLAQAAGIDVAGFAETVEAYNRDCSTGKDSVFRKKVRYLYTIEQGPFYAVEVRATTIGLTGAGLDIDRMAECATITAWQLPAFTPPVKCSAAFMASAMPAVAMALRARSSGAELRAPPPRSTHCRCALPPTNNAAIRPPIHRPPATHQKECSMISDDRLLDMLERATIKDRVDAYADALNHRDWERFRDFWTDDAIWSTSAPKNQRVEGGAEMTEFVKNYQQYQFGFVFQMPHALVIDELQPHFARLHHTLQVQANAFTVFGIYYDEMVKEDDGIWRFRRRDYQISYYEDRELPGQVYRQLPDPEYRMLPRR
jgi:ketosteroid isomerase-like protein